MFFEHFSQLHSLEEAGLMQRLSESLDNDRKNVTNALLDIAPRVVRTQEAVDAGELYDVQARLCLPEGAGADIITEKSGRDRHV